MQNKVGTLNDTQEQKQALEAEVRKLTSQRRQLAKENADLQSRVSTLQEELLVVGKVGLDEAMRKKQAEASCLAHVVRCSTTILVVLFLVLFVSWLVVLCMCVGRCASARQRKGAGRSAPGSS